jgi:hypothetical protein
MANSIPSFSLSDKTKQINSNISTNSTINNFLSKTSSSNASSNNKDEQNIMVTLSGLLTSLVGSQEVFKNMLVTIMTSNLSQLETKVKLLIKKYTLELLSCGVDAKLNLPNGVMEPQPPAITPAYPFIDQYDFYGLFSKSLNNPVDKLHFDDNLNTFIKTNIDSKTTTFTWKNQINNNVAKFTYNNSQEKILISSPTTSNWGPNGITVKEFADLYIDSINLFPTSSVIKSLIDQTFNIQQGTPYDADLNFVNKLLGKHCNCKPNNINDDHSKSSFNLEYTSFIPNTINETDSTVNTTIKFGPVDAPYPDAIIPKQPNLNESYTQEVILLSDDAFKLANKTDKTNTIGKTITNVNKSVTTQTTNTNSSLSKKYSIPNVNADANLKMLLNLPVILTQPLLSPKMTMYFGVIYKRYYIQNPTKPLWKNKEEYYQFMDKLLELVVREILEYLQKKLFDIIKKEIIKLIKKIIVKVVGEKILGYTTQLKSILDIIKTLKGKIPPTTPLVDFKKCSSVLDGINALFNIPNLPPGSTLPAGLPLMGMVKSGLSPTLVTQDAVKYMNDAGMNTSPLPDGTPNPNVVIANSIAKAMIKQLQTNANIQVTTINSVVYGQGGATIM